MELITLNDQNQGGKLIENFDALIWSERFNDVGDFQLTTGNVPQFLNLMPEGQLLSLRESTVAMVVETHQIDRKKNAAELLTIKGRSFESILDRRVAVQSIDITTSTGNWTVNVKTPSDLAYYIIYKIVVEGILDPADIFPSGKVQFPTPVDYLTSTGPTRGFDVSRGNLLATVLGLLQTENGGDLGTVPVTPPVVEHGIRSVRPSASGTAIAIEIYTGTNRTDTVYFDGTRDLLDDGTYLFSKVASLNAAYGVGTGMFAKMHKGATEPTGLERRVGLVDASTSGLGDVGILRNEVQQSLAEAPETAIFDGSINEDLSPYVFGVDYQLGDIVRIVGDYGLDTEARVTEYIRSFDATGRKAFPKLTALNP